MIYIYIYIPLRNVVQTWVNYFWKIFINMCYPLISAPTKIICKDLKCVCGSSQAAAFLLVSPAASSSQALNSPRCSTRQKGQASADIQSTTGARCRYKNVILNDVPALIEGSSIGVDRSQTECVKALAVVR